MDEDDGQRLMSAAEAGNLQQLRTILTTSNIHFDSRNKEGVTALMLAAANGHLECVKELLKHGCDPAVKKLSGATALLFASQSGRADVVEELLKQKHPLPLVNIPTYDGVTPLHAACDGGHFEVFDLLLRNGACVNSATSDGATALFLAAQTGNVQMVNRLLTNNVNPNCPRTDGATPLWISCQTGSEAVVERLLEAGADINQCRQDGSSPLCKASQKGHLAIVQTLLKHSPVLGLLPNGDSALHTACVFGHLPVVQELLAAAADVNLKNEDGLTPQQLAQIFGHNHVISFIQELTAHVDPQTRTVP